MKFMVGLLLLAIIAMGAVSASEDIVDDETTAIEPADESVIESVDESVIESVDEETTEEAVSESEEEISDSVEAGDSLSGMNDGFFVEIYEQPLDGELIFFHTFQATTRNGNLSVFVNGGKRISYSIVNGEINNGGQFQRIYIADLGIKGSGTYTIKVSFFDDDQQTEATLDEKTISFAYCVIPTYSYVLASDEISNFTVIFPDATSGTVTIYEKIWDDDANEYLYTEIGSANIVNHKANIQISGPSLYKDNNDTNLLIDYTTNVGDGWIETSLTVLNNSANVSASLSPIEIREGDNAVLTLNAADAGSIYLIVDGVETNFTHVSSLKHSISGLTAGTHKIRVIFDHNLMYSPDTQTGCYIWSGTFYSNSFILTVKEKDKTAPAKIVAKDYTAFYNKGTYTVTVYGTDGKVAKGTSVVFKINGKKIAAVKTNAKGVAKVKIPNRYVPKKYKISATALGKTETKNLVVKQVLKLKKVAVKKSAKKLLITASLKEGKKAITGKKITFRFKGKKYVAKTNKKGVAKITIKKNVLKKLKKGKKLTYKATYLKDTVKRTVKVKK